MTDRLYYTDAYAREFDARVLDALDLDGRPAVVLDRTAFYPTSGGQPFDTGTLGGIAVSDVIDREDDVVHVLAAPLQVGTAVQGVIDWTRRFDHMQQHTGQHVLSAAFDSLLGVRTESFHLGAASATIDLSRIVTPAEIAKAEDEANRVVWEDRGVSVRFADAAAAAELALRKESLRTGTLRLIDIEGCDVSACGGTHVSRTGAIGVIAVGSWEKVRGASRIEFVCGGRALRAYRGLRDATAASIKLLSVLPADLPNAIERLQADLKAGARAVRQFQAQLAVHEAARLAAAAGDSRVVVAMLEGWDQNGLKAIASALTGRPGYSAALFGGPSPFSAVVARAPDSGADAAAVLRALIGRFGGKGGGRPDLAQGGGLEGDPNEIARCAEALLAE
jgi:alanyl-tRNA synthetase